MVSTVGTTIYLEPRMTGAGMRAAFAAVKACGSKLGNPHHCARHPALAAESNAVQVGNIRGTANTARSQPECGGWRACPESNRDAG